MSVTTLVSNKRTVLTDSKDDTIWIYTTDHRGLFLESFMLTFWERTNQWRLYTRGVRIENVSERDPFSDSSSWNQVC